MEGQRVKITVSEVLKERSIKQNRYYWGVYLPEIANQTGEQDLNKLHELFKGKFLTTGIVQVLGEKVRMKKSTTDLNKEEFSLYIQSIEAFTQVSAPPTINYGL